jgi:hypothetical protein
MNTHRGPAVGDGRSHGRVGGIFLYRFIDCESLERPPKMKSPTGIQLPHAICIHVFQQENKYRFVLVRNYRFVETESYMHNSEHT